jgi:alkylhydroperoxidase family enzyme
MAVAPGRDLSVLSDAERCAVEYARQAAFTHTCDDTMFARLRSLFTSEEIVDLVTTTGWYHLCAVVLGSLKVELEGSSL